MHAADRLRGSVPVFLHPRNPRVVFGITAQLPHLGRDAEQDGKRVIRRRDRRSVGVRQSPLDRQRIGPVPALILHDGKAGNRRRIRPEIPRVEIPVHQVVRVDQRGNVHVRGVVAPHLRGEIPAQRRRVSDHQVIIIIFGACIDILPDVFRLSVVRRVPEIVLKFKLLRRGRGHPEVCGAQDDSDQDDRQEKADSLFHRRFPPLPDLPARIIRRTRPRPCSGFPRPAASRIPQTPPASPAGARPSADNRSP